MVQGHNCIPTWQPALCSLGHQPRCYSCQSTLRQRQERGISADVQSVCLAVDAATKVDRKEAFIGKQAASTSGVYATLFVAVTVGLCDVQQSSSCDLQAIRSRGLRGQHWGARTAISNAASEDLGTVLCVAGRSDVTTYHSEKHGRA